MTQPLLLICDHRGEGLSDALRPLASVGFRLEATNTLAQTHEAVEAHDPDLLVVDPLSRGGVVELEQIDRARAGAHLPVLLVAEPDDPLPAVVASRSLHGGLWDLVYRDAPIEEYLLRIDRLRTQAEGLEELAEMRYQAVHDDRTGLLRPVPFQERLEEHFSAAQRHRFELAFLLVDLDGFGQVNKDYDHTVGDQVITLVGKVIRNTLRAEDVGGRLGGDEFGVAIPYTQKVDAARVVNRIRDQIQALSGPIEGARRDVRVTASLGFETFDGRDLDSVEELRRHAEIALRQAKSVGGNRGLYYRSLHQEDESGQAHKDRA